MPQRQTLQIWRQAKADDYKTLQETLSVFGDADYLAFNRRIIPDLDRAFGVRMPVLRRILQALKKNPHAQELWEALCLGETFEERMLAGMLLPELHPDFTQTYDRIRRFLPMIDNWAVCDTTAGALKGWTQQHQERLWEQLPVLVRSTNKWERRFGVVLLLHFQTPGYLKKAENLIAFLQNEREYYVQMGVAWVMSYYFFIAPDVVTDWLRHFPHDDIVNLTIRKVGESHRGSAELRMGVKKYKR
ncbi:MAG TPA: DNA alkylation repair protein [Bacillota bacterium]|nr:DNA alkylation repair protein [Bacillota bacterium]